MKGNIASGGAVEHKQPKSKVRALEYSWDNFLLGCINCNAVKGCKDINDSNIGDFAWPDVDDTYHMIQYDPVTLMPSPADNLSDEDKERVSRLIELVGLDRPVPKEGSLTYRKASDTRVEERKKCAEEARSYKAMYLNLIEEAKPVFVTTLEYIVQSSGFWSIWMHELEDIPEMKEALLRCLPGTRIDLFE